MSSTITSVECTSGTYKIGDNVELWAYNGESWQGRIVMFELGKRKIYRMRVQWFYRPEETVGGRQPFHGKEELLESDHFDWLPLACLKRKIQVPHIDLYIELKSESKPAEFFTRFKYLALTGEIIPDEVPVFCICEMPYNPDLSMVCCYNFLEWYHTSCLGLKVQDPLAQRFQCDDCGV